MQLIGHRGARGEAPENTVEGFRYARGLGLSAVEFDVRLTVDEQVVVMHDRDVDRTTDGAGPVAELTRAEIAALDAREHPDRWPSRCAVPTFEDVLDATSDFDQLCVEVKRDAPARLVVLIPKVVEEIRRHGAGERVVLTSFDITALALAREVAPELSRGFIGDWDSPAALTVARLLDCQQADVRVATTSTTVVDSITAAGMRVVGWPCNTDEEFESLTGWGADAATTDYPSRFLASVQDGYRSG